MGFVSALSPKDLEKAKEELNEDPKTRDEAIKAFGRKCKSSPKIPACCWPRLDENFLIRFLRVAKFDQDKALERMAKYFEVQRQWPELYGNFKFDTVKELLLAGVSEMMPKRDDDGVMYTVFRKN